MPVTAKLSKALYDRLGEDIANELVEWFNMVDATYRSDLREINELSWSRFDARLEQRLAQFESKLEQRLAQADAKTEQRMSQLEGKIDQRIGLFETRLEQRVTQLDSKIDRRFDGQTRLMILAWTTIMAAVIGIGLR